MTATIAPAAFDVCGELPAGTTVLEASAGTGKTFTIAALAARYVAEGRATLPQLMLVTFGREATTELRERVRERLVTAARGLADPAAARAGSDGVLALLAGAGDPVVDDAEVARRRARLEVALAGFDAATIATTHQFCHQMLEGLGIAGDRDPGAVFAESIDDLVTEVVDDFYVRKYGTPAAEDPVFSRAEALGLARAAVYDAQARLEPVGEPPGSAAGVRHAFATAVRAEVARRKRAAGLYTYDDMLTRLSGALRSSPAAARRLRERYAVVLVDEFQDTDPVQWHILRTAFHGHTTLVLIGDPKQAIYAFRGADVVSYLDATRSAARHATLARNWRSEAPLLGALDTVFAGAALGDDRIRVHRVDAAHPGRRLRGAPVDTPLRIRVLPRAGLPQWRRLVKVPGARAAVARDCAADIAALLASPATITRATITGATVDDPVRPGDVAVLVRTNLQAGAVRDALEAAGVPAVVTGTASVFGTPVARDWLTLLEALEQPRAARVRAAALTCFVGVTAGELAGAGGKDADSVLDEVGGELREWAAVLHARGVAALLETITTTRGLPRRLLATEQGERVLTDLRHVGQALHAASTGGHLGPAALVDWLRHRITDAAADTGTERSRRLESDAAAVQIITVHRSKGLEFPVVHVPFAWDRFTGDPEHPLLHDDDGARVLDVGGPDGQGWAERCARHRLEEAGEDLRLLYVALTRARSQVVAWWVPATTVGSSPLHRVLIGRGGVGGVLANAYAVPSTDAAVLDALRALTSDELAVEPVGSRAVPVPPARAGGVTDLAAARFARAVDTAWRRTSYTALTAAAHDGPARAVSEPEEPGTVDEPPPGSEPAEDQPAAGPDLRSPMADLPVGAAFGTLVHAVFEAADLTAPDLVGELTARCAEQLARRPLGGLDAATLGAALAPAARTPLDPGGLRLADLAPCDRLAELDFELPLGGGDLRGGTPLDLRAVAALLRTHLPTGDPLAGYADDLAALGGTPQRGYLTGSIDAVLRRPDGRFLVVDYKTNWLGPPGGDLTAGHYAFPRLAEAMRAAHYPLQALLYAAALHRFLRWRLPGYDPERHLGGVAYLFVRGMCGPDTPVVDGHPCGVFAWHPPAALVTDLSALLDGPVVGGRAGS